jgi:glutathione S-transferase fosA5
MIRGINHITLAVSVLEASVRFYTGVLGFELLMRSDRTAYFLAGDLWLCVVEESEVETLGGYSHIAFDIAERDFQHMAERVRASGAQLFKENESEGSSLYFLDPDGHKLEIHCGTWQSRLEAIRKAPWGNAKVFR